MRLTAWCTDAHCPLLPYSHAMQKSMFPQKQKKPRPGRQVSNDPWLTINQLCTGFCTTLSKDVSGKWAHVASVRIYHNKHWAMAVCCYWISTASTHCAMTSLSMSLQNDSDTLSVLLTSESDSCPCKPAAVLWTINNNLTAIFINVQGSFKTFVD